MFEQSLCFIEELEKLKKIERMNLVLGGERRENSAEHSWHSAMTLWVLKRYIPWEDVDYDKVIRMLLIHDIVEIDAGDVSLYDDAGRLAVQSAEQKGAERIFGLLPEEEGKEMLALWEEFEACETKEAKVARAMDGFQPVVNYLLVKKRHHDLVVTKEQVMEKKALLKEVSPFLWEKLKTMIEESSAYV